MAKVFAVLGGDRRQYYLTLYLRAQGYQVCTLGVPGLQDEGDLSEADAAVLPTPVLDEKGGIRGLGRKPEEVSRLLPQGIPVFGGAIRGAVEAFPTATDVLTWEELTQENARFTAEGALGILLSDLPLALSGQEILVIGMGRIGLHLAKLVLALGARVTLSVRAERDKKLLSALGIPWEDTGLYRRGLSSYLCVCNTVPFPVLSRDQIAQTREDCLFLELASAPGGFFPEDCEALGRKHRLARGLPGIAVPQSAGEALAKSILAYLDPSKEV